MHYSLRYDGIIVWDVGTPVPPPGGAAQRQTQKGDRILQILVLQVIHVLTAHCPVILILMARNQQLEQANSKATQRLAPSMAEVRPRKGARFVVLLDVDAREAVTPLLGCWAWVSA